MISSLRVQHFRSYDDDSFEFDQGVNIVVGPNASGKTNLLEAILVACVGSSYRARDRDLIKHDEDWARVDVHDGNQSRTVKLKMKDESSRIEKLFEFDNVLKRRLKLEDTVPVVVFEPTHLQLLTGSPERRRLFLDGILERSVSGFSQLSKQYARTLLQRNALLKQGAAASSQMFAWNIRLSELGGRIAEARLKLIQQLNETVQQHYRDVSGGDHDVELHYKTDGSIGAYGSRMLKALEASEARDVARGFTGYGPHRDDLAVVFDGRPLADVASRGEVRTLLLSLKILELRLVEQARGKKPLLLLDDVFSELDGARRRALTDFLRGNQVFITTTDADIVVKHFTESSRIIPLS